MASNRIDVNVNGKDNTAAAFNSVSKNAQKAAGNIEYLNNNIVYSSTAATKAGNTIGSSISSGVARASASLNTLKSTAASVGSSIGSAFSKGASTATAALSKLGSAASTTFGAIRAGASAASQSLGGIGGAVASLAGGFGALQMAQMVWSGSTAKEFNQALLATKVGTVAAAEYTSQIQKIVAAVPGDDTFMNQLLSGAVSKQTNLSVAQLTALGNATADYLTTSQGMGKAQLETQMDLKEYILTGNTAQMERDSILKGQLGTLKGQDTVEARILALNKALKDEGYAGLSTLETTALKWEEIKGKVQMVATNIGEKLLPPIKSMLDYLLDLDTATGGWSTTIGFVAAGVVLLGIALAPIVTATASAATAMAAYSASAAAAAAANKGNPGPPAGGATGGGVPGVLKYGAIAAGFVGIGMAATSMWDAINQGAVKFGDTASFLTKVDGVWKPVVWQSPIPAMKDFNNQALEGMKAISAAAGNIPASIGNIGASAVNAGQQISSALGGAAAYIGGAWNNTMSWINSGLAQLSAAAAGTWNTIMGSATWAINTIMGAWNSLAALVGAGVSGTVSIFSNGLSGVWDAVSGLYRMVREGAQGIVSIVQRITGGPTAPPKTNNGIGRARGPGGPFDGMSFNYENYGGMQKSAWTGANSMSGNCVDMSLGLIQAAGGGSLVEGTWNGNPHVWANIAGKDYDPARKALNGTWSPPPRGPSTASAGTAIIIQGDVYGFEDFKKKVQQANNRMVSGVY